jgi:hypothetical protein
VASCSKGVFSRHRVVDCRCFRYRSPPRVHLSTLRRAMQRQDLTNRSSQPLAVPIFSFPMTTTLNSAANLGFASGG